MVDTAPAQTKHNFCAMSLRLREGLDAGVTDVQEGMTFIKRALWLQQAEQRKLDQLLTLYLPKRVVVACSALGAAVTKFIVLIYPALTIGN